MRACNLAPGAVVTHLEPKLQNLARRFLAVPESYHTHPRKTCKHNPAPTGIYVIWHIASGKVYIGSSVCIRCRWKYHKWDLKRNAHRNPYLQAAWNKYGEDAFFFSILEECSIDALIEREQYWMDTAQCTDEQFGFNLSPTAQSQRGVKRSEEFCKKLRERKTSEQTRELLRQANLGKKRPVEDCEKISKNHRSNKLSIEQIREIQQRYEESGHTITQRQLAKEYGVSGHTMSCIVRRTSRKYQTDIPLSGESTRKMSGMASVSEERRRSILQKTSAANIGRHHSEEHKSKISLANKGRPKKRRKAIND